MKRFGALMTQGMILSMAMAQAAGAQQATDVAAATEASLPADAPAQADVPADDTGQPDVVVTGSRLGSSGFRAPTPVTSFDGARLETRASTNIGDLLNEQPAFRNSSSPSQSQRLIGGGVTSLDLRGLGSIRTLTLVNGQRFTPTLRTGVLDVALIPTLLVEKVDVVTGGASAAYGSDAVAGVVNLVLANTFEGFRAKAQYDVSQEGDNAGPLVGMAVGQAFADGRGHLVLGGEYADSSGVGTIYTRDWGRRQPSIVAFGASRAAGVPANGFLENVRYSQQTPGGLVTAGPLRGLAFGPAGTTGTFRFGTVYSSLMVGGDNEGYNPNGNFPIITPTERLSALGRVSYDVADAVELFAEGSYGRNIGRGFTSYNQRSFVIGRDNVFLPAGVRTAMVNAGVSTITVGRLFTENGGLQQRTTRDTLRGLVGAQGAFAEKWKWDLSAQYGRSKSQELVYSAMLSANYDAAVNAVAGANGQPVCGPFATNPNLSAAEIAVLSPNCVPINIFGVGSPSAQAIDYVTDPSDRRTEYRRAAAAFNVNGSPFATRAGDVQFAIGAEYRKDTLIGTSNREAALGLFTSANGGDYRGSQEVAEGYVELGVPLLKEVAFARSLDLNAAFRQTHYSNSGWVSTWKLGATYEPASELRFRVTRSRDIRAPNLSELFFIQASGVNVSSAVNPFNGRTGVLNASFAGNTALTPEIANTLTGGVVFSPSWGFARNLQVSVDAFRIDLRDVITLVAPLDILNRCFQGGTQFCNAITFDTSNFGIANVAQQSVNLASLKTSGLDIEVQYRVPLEDIGAIPGQLRLRALATHTFDLVTTDLNGSVDRAGALQGNGVPSWTGNLNVDYTVGGFAANVNARYVSASTFDRLLVGPDAPNYSPTLPNSININRFPSATYVNLALSQTIESRGGSFQVFGGIDNLFDTDPPLYAMVGINSGGNPYDLVGRRYKVGVRASF